jgi:aromatic-amino-acid transaminase
MNPSVFSSVEMAPRDPILGLTEAFRCCARCARPKRRA